MALAGLASVDWEFKNSDTNYLTHNYHSYPAKFIPQIPRQLIETYSKPGELVLDPFCGSGSALVEAKLLGRPSRGIDINSLSCLISKVKTTPIPDRKFALLDDVLSDIERDINEAYGQKTIHERERGEYFVPPIPHIEHWFEPHVVKELSIMRSRVWRIKDKDVRDFITVGFSSIINRVSNMEEETRYASIKKNIPAKHPYKLLRAKLTDMVDRMRDFNRQATEAVCKVFQDDTRHPANLPEEEFDLIVTSPPYIYAWDYNLIHRFRLFWLGEQNEDVLRLRKNEIGSHLRLEREEKAAGDREVAISDYVGDMTLCMQQMKRLCKRKGRICIVLGGSTLEGKTVHSDRLIDDIGRRNGLFLEDKHVREIDATRKATNTKFAKIKTESIMVFRK
jgi:site-specific DNA-methyltransferase (cytosine-N4-specific)